MKKIKFPYVEINWLDAFSDDSWLLEKDLPKPAKIKSRGWLIKDKKYYVVLASTFAPGIGNDGEDQYGEVIAIPRGWIKKIKKLKIK